MNLEQTAAYFSSLPGVGLLPEKYRKPGVEPPVVLAVSGQRSGWKVRYSAFSDNAAQVDVLLLGKTTAGDGSRAVLQDKVTEAIFDYIRQKHRVNRVSTRVGGNYLEGYTTFSYSPEEVEPVHRAAVEFLTVVQSAPYHRLRRQLLLTEINPVTPRRMHKRIKELHERKIREFLQSLQQ